MFDPQGPCAVPGTSPALGIRGMVATRDIAAGELIEVPPLLEVPQADLNALGSTFLRHYLFSASGKVVICLGYGSLYNHSADNNALVVERGSRLMIISRRPIAAGEEVCISYGDDQAEVAARYGF